MVSTTSTCWPIQRTAWSPPASSRASAAPWRRMGRARCSTALRRSAGAASGVGWSSSPGMSKAVPSGSRPLARDEGEDARLQQRRVDLQRGEAPGEAGLKSLGVGARQLLQIALELLEVLGAQEHALRPQHLVVPVGRHQAAPAWSPTSTWSFPDPSQDALHPPVAAQRSAILSSSSSCFS